MYGPSRADRYITFLNSRILRLATDYDLGGPVEENLQARYLVIQKRSGGDGHVAIYQVDLANSVVSITHIFHTKQDWRNKLT